MEEHRTIKGVQPSVIIGTPGRMNDHLSKQNFDADTVSILIIDEFDKCLEFGFQEEMATVIGQLPGLQRRFLLSATDAEEIPQFTGLNKTIKLNFLNPEEQLTQRLHLYKVLSPEKDKLETLYKLLCTLGSQSTLVFCNHRESIISLPMRTVISIVTDVPPVGKPKEIHTLFFMLKKHCPDI